MGLFSSRDNFTFQIAQSGKERDRAVPDIVMGLGACVTFLQRKGALRALQGLALTLLVTAQYQGPLGRIYIQPNNIPEFHFKVRIIGNLKGLQPMWPNVIVVPDALYGALAYPWLRAPWNGRSIEFDPAAVESPVQQLKRFSRLAVGPCDLFRALP